MAQSQQPPLRELSFEELEAKVMGPPAATQLARGVTLFTVDGSRIGNAIVVKKIGQTRDWQKIADLPIRETLVDPKSTVEPPHMLDVWLLMTDFGNVCRMTEREIFSHFTLGKQHDFETWWDERLETTATTVELFK